MVVVVGVVGMARGICDGGVGVEEGVPGDGVRVGGGGDDHVGACDVEEAYLQGMCDME